MTGGRSPAQAPGAQHLPGRTDAGAGRTEQIGAGGTARLAPPAIITLEKPIRLVLVRIPAGEFLMGSDPQKDEDTGSGYRETPQHPVYLSDFYIGKVPVTNEQYAAFVRATKHRLPRHWSIGRIPPGEKNHPVTDVTWDDAVAFCRWRSEETEQEFRLPTEAEWEKAAKQDGRPYPWGDEPPDKDRCNFNGNIGNTTPVGQYPRGATPDYGVLDMAGNVEEWCNDWYADDYYTYVPELQPAREPSAGELEGAAGRLLGRQVRGGSVRLTAVCATPTSGLTVSASVVSAHNDSGMKSDRHFPSAGRVHWTQDGNEL